MDIGELLLDLFGRVDEHVGEALDGLAPEHLTATVAPGVNTIAWLVWHLTRVQDHHVSELLDAEQVWVTGDWGPRVGVVSDPDNTGYGHEPDEVLAIRPESADVLRGYHDAVSRRTVEYLRGLTPADLDRVVDRRWDPPVTLGVRLISVADDDIQHAGQAAFARGVLERS
ncbi:MAG: DUF664 domain-containing protein [Actinobacteria bacterium]|nr:DUF664 domain-containing protein [Actinomycetota bacterium]